jgi:gliding motility-associated-like protein
MLRIFLHIILALSLLNINEAFSQDCTNPLPPVLTSVSVRPETGIIDISWSPSPSDEIAAYILYWHPRDDADWISIDTVWDNNARSYAFTTTALRYISVSFVVAAYRLPLGPSGDGCPSVLSNVLSTIFCTAETDTCNSRILLKWNRYSDFPKKVTEYKILVSENGGQLVEKYTAAATADNFIVTEFTTNNEYCFAVRAILEEGSYSSSNKTVCQLIRMQKPPSWINADFVTVSEQEHIILSFTVDPLSEINRFILERKTGNSGAFEVIGQPIMTGGKVEYTDNEADVKAVYYYRLSALNNCQIRAGSSAIISNVVLSSEAAEDRIRLIWNAPVQSNSGSISYEIFINTGNGFETLAAISDTVFTISLKDIMYKITTGEICFMVYATIADNPHGTNGRFISSAVCTGNTESVTVPNIFTPNNDLLNDFFKPVLSFTPSDYHLIISNRQGKILFESRDFQEEWDGSSNGDPRSQGVFLWFLELTTPSGKKISKTGTVTIFMGR